MKVIILAEGFGTRLQSIISDRPKPLAPVAGKPFLEHVINWLVKHNQTEIIFSVSYKADQIMKFVGDGSKFGIKPFFSLRPQPSGTGGAIKFATQFLSSGEEAIVLNGDTFFDINLQKFVEYHKQNKAFLTIALSHVLDVHRYGQVKISSNGQLTEFVEKSPQSNQILRAGLVNGGVYFMSSKALEIISKLNPPFSVEKDLFSVYVKKKKMFGYISDTTHYDIGTPAGYRRTNRVLSGSDEILIRSRAPLRISFGGGGTDVSPFDEKVGGCVLSGTINKYVYGQMKLRDDRKVRIISSDFKLSVAYDDVKNIPFDGQMDLIKSIIKRINVDYGFEMLIRSDVPPQSGMGSSASVCVAVIGLFNHLLVENKMTKSQIAEMAFKVESEDLKNNTGRQDQYAAVFGGFNIFEFLGNDFVKVNPVTFSREIILEMEKNLVIAYIGKRDNSGIIHDAEIIPNEKKVIYLTGIKKIAFQVYDSLSMGDMNRFGNLLEETWELKKRAFPNSTNRFIEKLYTAAKKSGAIGGRVIGAGGGGHMVFYCQSGTEHEVAKALQSLGAKIVDFSFDHSGLQTWEIL